MGDLRTNELTAALGEQHTVRRSRKVHTFEAIAFPAPGSISGSETTVVDEFGSIEDIDGIPDTFRRLSSPSCTRNSRHRSNSDPPRCFSVSNQQDGYLSTTRNDTKQPQQYPKHGSKNEIAAAAETNTDRMGQLQIPGLSNTSGVNMKDALWPLERNRSGSDGQFRPRKVAWAEPTTMPNDAGPENARPIEPSTGKVFPPHSRVSLAPFLNKLRGKRGFAKVQPIKRDAGESPAPLEANAQLLRAGNSQEGATAIQRTSLVQLGAAFMSNMRPMADTRLNEQRALGATQPHTLPEIQVREPSNTAKMLPATSCDCTLNDSLPISSLLCIHYDDATLTSFLSEAIAARRLAICEEIEAALNTVKINGCRVSLLELREDLAYFYPIKCKSLEP